MKSILTISFFFVVGAVVLSAQDKKPLSPPMSLETTIEDTDITIKYNAPSKRGRVIFGGLEDYDQVWRTGANEATTITFGSNAKVEGKDIAAGTYSLFTIPGEDKWTVIFNKTAKQWGAYSYKQADDALRVVVTPKKNKEIVETMTFEAMEDGIVLKWDDVMVPFEISK
ncbi:MAG: DUF2911 domain-containing protein [Bacteroidota bacterium]